MDGHEAERLPPDSGLSGTELHYLSRSGSEHPTEAAGSGTETRAVARTQTGPHRFPRVRPGHAAAWFLLRLGFSLMYRPAAHLYGKEKNMQEETSQAWPVCSQSTYQRLHTRLIYNVGIWGTFGIMLQIIQL